MPGLFAWPLARGRAEDPALVQRRIARLRPPQPRRPNFRISSVSAKKPAYRSRERGQSQCPLRPGLYAIDSVSRSVQQESTGEAGQGPPDYSQNDRVGNSHDFGGPRRREHESKSGKAEKTASDLSTFRNGLIAFLRSESLCISFR